MSTRSRITFKLLDLMVIFAMVFGSPMSAVYALTGTPERAASGQVGELVKIMPPAPARELVVFPLETLADEQTPQLRPWNAPALDDAGNADVIYDVGCMEEEAGFGLNCTANDISIANATNIQILDDGCAYPGDTVTFKADFEVLLTAQARHDVGLWFATDGDPNGDGARTGSCSAATPAYAPDMPWLDLDGTLDPYPGTNDPSGVQDTCGDIDDDHNPLYPSVELTVMCVDDDANGKLDLPNCTSWRQPGDNDLCTSPVQAVPGAPSKCKCDTGFNVDIPVPGQIIIDKVTDPAGQPTSFDFILDGDTIDPINFSLTDGSDPFESSFLYAGTYSVVETANSSYSTTVTCDDGSPASTIDLQPGEIVTCTFTNKLLTGTLIVQKNLVNDNLGPLTCPDFSYTLDGGAAVPFESDCSNSQTVLAGIHTVVEVGLPIEGYTTTYSNCENVNVPAGGTATCTITNDDIAIPHLAITKAATEMNFDEVGDVLHYTITATNDGNVTLTATVTDPLVSDLTCMPANGSALAPGESMICTATHTVTQADIDAGHWANQACVDDGPEGAPEVCDDEDVPADQNPLLSITKAATEENYDAVGDILHYTIVATNIGNITLEAVTVTDPLVSDLTCMPANGSALAPGEAMTCAATHTVTQADIEAGHWANQACVDDGAEGAPEVCDDEDVPADKNPAITVDKTADPTVVPETGGDALFTFKVTNTGNVSVTITSLEDSVFGTLAGDDDCALGTVLAVDSACEFSFTKWIEGNFSGADHVNMFTAVAEDNDGTDASDDDDAAVDFSDVAPDISISKTADPTHVPETGADVTFTFVVTNEGVEDVTLTSLTDTVFGDLNGQGDCVTGGLIPVGGSYSCSITKFLAADDLVAHYNLVTAVGSDDDGTTDEATDNETVTFDDVAPAIRITKTADPTSVPETGGEVTFTFLVENIGMEDVTLTSLTDTVFGDLNGQGTCTLPQTILIGGSYSCEYTINLAADNLVAHYNVTTATAVDDDNTPATDDDDATVTYTDVLPTVDLDKSALPTTLPEPGGVFTFTLTITNTSVETVEILSLSDDNTLSQECLDLVGTTLEAGASTSCTYTVTHTDAGSYPNTANITVADNDNNQASAFDDETVAVTDVLPTVDIVKSAVPTTLPEPGGVFTFTLIITNTSVETVTITDVSDTQSGATEFSDCAGLVGMLLLPGGSVTCSYTVTHTDAGSYPNTASVTVQDNENNTASDTDDETVTVSDVLPTVDLDKSALPTTLPEPGGVFTFTLTITNSSIENVTITGLGDSNVLSPADTPECLALVGMTLTPGQTVSCEYDISHTNAGTYENTADVTVADNEGNPAEDSDSETVTVTNVAPDITITKTASPTHVPETGGNVTFTFLVENIGVENVTLTSLVDDQFGDLNGQGDCVSGGLIPVGGSYSCSITVFLSSDSLTPHTNIVTAVGTDDDGTSDTATDDEIVTFDDIAPLIQITKSADPTHVPEIGGDVTFTFLVENIGVEDVSLTSLTDTVFGDLDGQGTCTMPQTILIGGSYSCTYTINLAADDLVAHYNVTTATAVDDDNTPATDDDDETVTFDDVAPDITITKIASTTHVPETGGNVTFTFLVENIGVEDVTLTSLNDTKFGDLNSQGDCVTGSLILVGGSYSCSITVFLYSDSLTDHYNVVTAVGTDDDGTTDEATDNETVTFDDVAPQIQITKTASPTHVPETGGDVTFTFLVENIGVEDVSLTTLTDTVFGDLDGKGTCVVPQTILIGDSYSCEYTVNLSSDSLTDHYNVTTATAVDDDNTPATDDDDETVTFDDVAPQIQVTKTANPTSVPETGGDVTFTFLVENIGVEDVTLTSLTDTVFGDLNGQGTCALPQIILVGSSYTCEYTINLAADDLVAHYNVTTATAVDDDNTTATDEDDETVTFTDVAPDISITKTADPTHVPETGGNVTFTFLVQNIGVEDVTLTTLTDTIFGDLDGRGTCDVPQTILIGGFYSCEYTVNLSSDSLTDHYNVTTATAVDDDNTTATDEDDETVTFDNVAPTIRITKTADPTHVPETGGNVTFTFLVENIGVEDVTLTELTDTVFGDLNGKGTCVVPQTILIGGSYSCEFTVNLSSDSLTAHTNVVTATAVDDENTPATDDDDETVTFDDLLPDIAITKTASPTSVPETGGNVEFTIVVTNNSLEDTTIDSLVDTDFDLAAHCPDAVDTVLPYGQSYTCTFTEFISGDYGVNHENTATVEASDNDGNSDTASDDETVTFTDILPDIAITKTASPTSVPETGGNVEFTLVVTNNSLEDATIDSLVDSDFDLAAHCPDAVGTVLGYHETYTCTFTEFVAGDYESGISHENTATVVASDNDGNSDTASDDATVDFTNVTADIDVEKYVSVDGGMTWADADSPTGPFVKEGDTVQFKFVVTNIGNVALSGITLTDSDFGLAGCTIPATLAAGASFECVISTTAMTAQHINTATASGSFTDGAGNTETDTDTDDANYYGLMRGQPSIQIESLSININRTLTTVTGLFFITDQSTSAHRPDGYLVAITTYGVRWEQKGTTKKATFQPVTPTAGCTYSIVAIDYQQVAGWSSGDPIIFDETVTIGYTCTFGSNQLLKGGTLKGTAYAGIFGRTDMEFTYSSTVTIPR